MPHKDNKANAPAQINADNSLPSITNKLILIDQPR